MEKRIFDPAFSNDITAENIFKALEERLLALGLRSFAYYHPPIAPDDDGKLVHPWMILTVDTKGVFIVERVASNNAAVVSNCLDRMELIDTSLYSKFLNSAILRKGRREIYPGVHQIAFCVAGAIGFDEELGVYSTGKPNELIEYVLAQDMELPVDGFDEINSIVSAGKGITRKVVREDADSSAYIKAINAIEGSITNFDEDQFFAALSMVHGPQRIRGLAGSGKTVVIAMKAAMLHLNFPDYQILVTYWTKSLYIHIKELVTRFFRAFKLTDPDWTKIQIMHAWGGKYEEGVYFNSQIENGYVARSFNKMGPSFSALCEEAVRRGVRQKYDYVLIDEGQDVPVEFYRLCYALTKGEVYDRPVIWAYDDLQTILDVDPQNVPETFGLSTEGRPLIDLARAEQEQSRGIIPHDIVLKKCYRNPGVILVTAHCLGFGVYASYRVQRLQNEQHWSDLGYTLEEGAVEDHSPAVLLRPQANSPLNVDDYLEHEEIIQCYKADDIDGECGWIASQVLGLLSHGLKPHDIMFISLDDRHAKEYFSRIAQRLAEQGVYVNNAVESGSRFFVENCVTVSTIYRAKGNETPVVFVGGIDALRFKARERKARNRIFTALTRAKMMVRISGVGSQVDDFIEEIKVAVGNYPKIIYDSYPSKDDVDTIDRDYSEKSARDAELLQLIQDKGYTAEDLRRVIASQGGKYEEK